MDLLAFRNAATANNILLAIFIGVTLRNCDWDDNLIVNKWFGTGSGFSADEIVTGTLSADRIMAGSITTDKISSTFGQELDISSNKSVNITVSKAVEKVKEETEELIGYRLEIISTSDILSSDITSTTLSVRVWHGSQNVTDDMSASKFNWKRVSSDAVADELWNANHTGMKSITVTTLDVYYSATYSCEMTE